ncbi:uncharacterized protein DSM5745_11358 [Aspergillus mulundensis]|uniref:Paraoxonase n=1 Tax=Aspergillus mulundensis TaxID=1810919 RepID=A0A3D8Q842_9EURO|nr:Uncharacterized protein DSM5745_11358 [Aspergillus mulundensis]RDW57840.1 Uncharacterized protein DSM5745_11358 [Aspergillus mulundensis]
MPSTLSLSRLAIFAVLAAISLPWLQSRQYTLSLLFKNKPENLPEINAFSSSSLKFTDKPGLRNCEDGIVVPEDGFAILSCDPGRDLWNTVMGTFYHDHGKIPNGKLWLYNYALDFDAAPGTEGENEDEHENQTEEKIVQQIHFTDTPPNFSFHPLGIDLHRASSTLFVANHAIDGSRLEVFILDTNGRIPVARYVKSILHPLLPGPNSLIALSEHELYVTNDHYILRRKWSLGALFETYAGIPGGTVVYVNLNEEKEVVEMRNVARGPFANGVALVNETTVAVAVTAAAEVRLYKRTGDSGLTYLKAIRMPFLPDNLATEKNGSLLIAGHPHPPSLDKTVHERRACIGADGVVPKECWKSTAPSWVARWSEDKGVESLYITASEFGSSATAAKDVGRNVGIVTGLYESGILVWRE